MNYRNTVLRLLALLVVLGFGVSDAYAWLRVRNSSLNNNHVYVAVSISACSGGGCNGLSRQLGWWGIYLGNWATVWGGDQEELFWKMYAEGNNGGVWAGGANDFKICTPWAAFDYCPPTNVCASPNRMLRYRSMDNSSCCGPFCFESADRQVNLVD